MKKEDLVEELVQRGKVATKKAGKEIIDEVFNIISERLHQDDIVSISGFGKFYTKISAARTGRNPKTGELVNIPEKRVVKFTVAKQLKEFIA